MRLLHLFEEQQKDFLTQLKASLLRLKTKGVELKMQANISNDQCLIQRAKMFGPEVQKVEEVVKNSKKQRGCKKSNEDNFEGLERTARIA